MEKEYQHGAGIDSSANVKGISGLCQGMILLFGDI